MSTVRHEILAGIVWSGWQPHQGCWLGSLLPREPGLYRIRREGRTDVDYIGKTGTGLMNLARRQAMLKSVYGTEMPYRDPHTAGPALGALRHASGCEFEVSVCPVSGTTPWRKGLACVAIAIYHQERNQSPNVNFGRMPSGYRMSSGNNSRLVATGRRFRGGPCDGEQASHSQSIAPAGSLDGCPTDEIWCGHRWSHWMPITEGLREPALSAGLYRIRRAGAPTLVYIGEGRIHGRLLAHVAKGIKTNRPQAQFLTDVDQLEASFVTSEEWLPHQRLELKNDLIAAHLLTTGEIPAAQFMG